LFRRVDANGAGKISRAGHDASVNLLPRFRDDPDEAEQLFERLDADEGGMVTAEEFERLTTGRSSCGPAGHSYGRGEPLISGCGDPLASPRPVCPSIRGDGAVRPWEV